MKKILLLGLVFILISSLAYAADTTLISLISYFLSVVDAISHPLVKLVRSSSVSSSAR